MTTKTKIHRMTLDEALRPLEMTCGKCGGQMTVYPDSKTGIGFCPACSPSWLESFATFCMNEERTKRGLAKL